MEPRNRFRQASRARHPQAAEEDRGDKAEKKSVVGIQEKVIAEIGAKVGSKAKQVTAHHTERINMKKPTKPSPTHPNAPAFPPGLSGPALRALASAGIRSLSAVAKWREPDLAKLHGMGPKGVRILKKALAAEGRHFHPARP